MSTFKTLLLVVVGKLRKHMDAVLLTMGGILIPLGFYLRVEQPRWDGYGTALVIVGLVVWLLAYFFVKRKEAREQTGRNTINYSPTFIRSLGE